MSLQRIGTFTEGTDEKVVYYDLDRDSYLEVSQREVSAAPWGEAQGCVESYLRQHGAWIDGGDCGFEGWANLVRVRGVELEE